MTKNTATKTKKKTTATKPTLLHIAPTPAASEAHAPHDEGVGTVSMHVLGSAAKQVHALYLALGRIAACPPERRIEGELAIDAEDMFELFALVRHLECDVEEMIGDAKGAR